MILILCLAAAFTACGKDTPEETPDEDTLTAAGDEADVEDETEEPEEVVWKD